MADVYDEATGELSRIIGVLFVKYHAKKVINFIEYVGDIHNFFLTKYGALNMFIDCFFRSVPKGFYQLMVIMVYSASNQTYVAVFVILLQSKNENVYQHAIIMFIAVTGWTADAKTVTTDYEQALLKTVSTQFRESNIFPWKQAIRRKLVSLHIPEAINLEPWNLGTALFNPHQRNYD